MENDFLNDIADIHSHVVSGVDDGSSSPEESIAMLRMAYDEGSRTVFATPHYGAENGYDPDAGVIRRNFDELVRLAGEEVPGIRLFLGTEWYCADDLPERIRAGKAYTMNGTEYVLTEFLEWGEHTEPGEVMLRRLKKLRGEGYRPILAHAERYRAIQQDWDLAKRIQDLDVLIQVNAYDLYLNQKAATKDLAQWLASERMISFIGSDMHGLPPKRSPKIREGAEWLLANTDPGYAGQVLRGNAAQYLRI